MSSAVPRLPALPASTRHSGGGGKAATPRQKGGELVPVSPRDTKAVLLTYSGAKYTLAQVPPTPEGDVRRLTPRNMQQIGTYIESNKKLYHSHRAGRLTNLIPDSPFVRMPESVDPVIGLSIAPVHPKESALDVPLRLQPPTQFHCPALHDPPLGTPLSSRIVTLLKGTSTVPQHWQGEKVGIERDVAHMNILRDLEMRLSVARRSQNPKQEGLTLFSMGALHYNSGAIDRAAKHFVLAANLFEQLGDPPALALCLNISGVCYYKLGSFKMALIQHKKQEELAGAYGRCVAQTNMGVCYAALGEVKYAEQAFADALSSAVEAKDTVLETIALGNAGVARMRVGDMRQAQIHLEQCLEHCSVAGDKVGAAVCLLLLGEVYTLVNDFQHSLFYYEHAFRVAEDEGCREVAEIARVSVGVARGNLAAKDSLLSAAKAMGAQFGIRDVLLCLPKSQEGAPEGPLLTADP